MQHTEIIQQTELALSRVTVSELIADRRPAVFVYSDTSIEEAVNILKVNNILSVPVFDSKEKRFIGVVDTLALVKYSTLGMFLKKGFIDTFSKAPVKDVLLDNEEMEGSILKFVLFHEDETLATVISTLARSGVHRAFVRKATDSTDLYALSQSDIIRYLHVDRVDIPPKSLRETMSKTVIAVRSDETAMSGFMKLWANKVQGLAVLDEHGKLVDTLSASDVRGMTSDKLQLLLLPIPVFKKSLQGSYMKPVDCTVEATLQDVIKKLVQCKVHRIWVVDHENKPAGVVSMTDILNVVCHKAGATA